MRFVESLFVQSGFVEGDIFTTDGDHAFSAKNYNQFFALFTTKQIRTRLGFSYLIKKTQAGYYGREILGYRWHWNLNQSNPSRKIDGNFIVKNVSANTKIDGQFSIKDGTKNEAVFGKFTVFKKDFDKREIGSFFKMIDVAKKKEYPFVFWFIGESKNSAKIYKRVD